MEKRYYRIYPDEYHVYKFHLHEMKKSWWSKKWVRKYRYKEGYLTDHYQNIRNMLRIVNGELV